MPVAPLRSIVPARRPLAALLLIAALAVAGGVAIANELRHERPRYHQCTGMKAPPIVEAKQELRCASPVHGVWIAREYRREHHDWIEHEIHIVNGTDHLFVDHTARVRDGNERGPAALGCMPDAVEFDTRGRAILDGDQLHIWGDSLVSTRARCDGASMSYSLDSWTGTVSGNTFESVNNDGDTAVNRPYRFTRIACE
jgi:hypothetical protein